MTYLFQKLNLKQVDEDTAFRTVRFQAAKGKGIVARPVQSLFNSTISSVPNFALNFSLSLTK